MTIENKFKVATLKQRPELFAETQALIESSFDYPQDCHFNIDFYPLFNEDNSGNLYILIDEDSQKPVAHLGVSLRSIKINDKSFPIALLGGISVKKEHQGQGLFNQLMNKVLKNYDHCVCLYFLWSDKVDLYNKYGFQLAFGQKETILKENSTDKNLNLFTKTKFKDLTTEEFQQIQNLYKMTLNNYWTIDRSETDWDNILKIESADLYITKDGNEITEYFVKNKGADLTDIVHEYGAKELMPLLEKIQSELVWTPELEETTATENNLKYMSLVRCGHANLFKMLIEHWSHEKVRVNTIQEGQIDFEFLGKYYKYNLDEFYELFFGPNAVTEFRQLSKPFYIFGLDSV